MSFSRTPPSSAVNGPAARAVARASQFRRDGRHREAVEAMRLAANLEPNNAQILYDLGVSCLGAGLFAEAAAACRRAVQIKPSFALAFWRLGVALGHCGEAEAALEALQKATELQPRLPDAQFRLGMLLEKSGRHREAAARYRSVLTGGPDARLRRIAEARALMMEGRDDDAERKLRRAVAIEPNDAAALSLLGSLLQDSGAFVEAASCFERALAQRGAAQDLAHLYYDLVRCRKVTAEDAVLLENLRSMVAQLGRAGETGIKLNLALGKALDDLGLYGEAMQRFDAAADLRARVWPVDVAAFERRVDNIIQRFSAEFIESKRLIGNPDPAPVLIFGMPRSGTTLCEQIVSSHPVTYGADELPYWDQLGVQMEGAAFNIDDQFMARGAVDCLSLLRQMGGDATRIVDKNPFNFQWAGLIHVALPRAALIHCRRSPIDTALSIHQTFFSSRIGFPTGGEALVRYYRAYERLMHHWRRVLPSDRFFEVQYEDLTSAPDETSKRMIAHLKLPWDDRCLHPELNARRVRTPSRWQVRQPIYRTAVGRWRLYEPHLGALTALARP